MARSSAFRGLSMSRHSAIRPGLVLAAAAPWLAGCAGTALTDRDCMTRVMYFESNRSSTEGMLAVGTTVMNRLDSPKYPKSVCAVVGQPHQFAPGALDKPMVPRLAARAASVADRVLAGERHPAMGPDAMFFHTAGLTFPYNNMHYVLEAGGNAFYEKRSPAEIAALARYTPRPTADATPRQDLGAEQADAGEAPPPDGDAPPPEGDVPPNDE